MVIIKLYIVKIGPFQFYTATFVAVKIILLN